MAAVAAATFVGTAAQAQPFDCSSPDPSMWPPPAKPYFMVAFDTSGSMGSNVSTNNSCGYPNDRLGHGRCALKNTMYAFSGQANFGLANFAERMVGCSGATCYNGCNYVDLPNNSGGSGCSQGCGNEPSPGLGDSSSRAGANILVPMLQDTAPPPPSNVPAIVSYVDNNCTNSIELFASGCTPLNGILRDMYRYYSNQWTYPGGGLTYTSPLTSVANGERACRSVNVILITDGDETCDQASNAIDAAGDLFNGFTKDGINWSVRTFVIDFGNAGSTADQIAAAGGTGTAQTATDESSLSIALANIIGGSVTPEVCNNVDDNCNGCIDEGYNHYCNVQPVPTDCCAWTTTAQRNTCLTSYQASITPGNPSGDLTLLPCTTVAQSQDPATWLCYDPKEQCDDVDNNCAGGIDEGVLKCGNPAHCPSTEICDGIDNDCNGAIDELPICNGCVPSAEICDGCDNDCDGFTDNGIAPIPCGLTSPPNCAGQLACNPPQPVPVGGCAPGGGYGTCSNSPEAEVCDGLDNDCDGFTDEGIPPTLCVPPGTPPGLIYGGSSQCQMGLMPCNGTCQGFVGPSPEVCDGIDNDCDGVIDDSPLGVGQPCGINQPPCTPGATACVNGSLVCQGGTGPQPEVCDGIDNNCNGTIDDPPLDDAPLPGQNGCWTEVGNCCQFPATNPDITWCPPPGATCNDVGALTAPCIKGLLVCSSGAWTCVNANGPQPEACDGIDNDCDGTIDNGTFPGVGAPCGSDVGECSEGAIACVGGILDCVGDVPPTPEICDALDNDCDGVIDNGLQFGGPCTPPYDMTAYPGPRDNFPCSPGVLMCDPVLGDICVGGVGPSPEICDNIDNDCDGSVDETGPQPDGIDGTSNPNPPPNVSIGDVCGINMGTCTEGAYACLNGLFACLGGQGPAPEQCDCGDNDCDGVVDNQNPNGPPICSSGKDCVSNADGCQCAAPCGGGEQPCPPGQKCEEVTSSETGQILGNYCVIDYDAICGNCTTKTVTDVGGNVLCGPPDPQLPPGCAQPPACVCKGAAGCQSPCYGVMCTAPFVCATKGANVGQCVPDSCYNVPCPGCDYLCHYPGVCVTNPCTDTTCPPNQVCKPTPDFMDYTCLGSCADVTCPSGEECKDGNCVPTCDPPCMMGQFCDTSVSPPVCATDLCAPDACAGNGCCDPSTGMCGECPCEGVICPAGETCQDGSCFGGGTGPGSGGGSSTTTSGAGGAGASDAVWGLPTGGGGCTCEAGAGASSAKGASWALLALAIGLARRRRKAAPRGSKRGEEVGR